VSDQRKGKGLKLRTVWLITYTAIVIVAGAILLPDYWYLWLIVLAIAAFRVAFYYVPPKQYKCSNCGNVFTKAAAKRSQRLRPSGVYEDRSKMRCPKCGSIDNVRVKGSKK